MTNLQIAEIYAERDRVINAYTRYPGTKEWEAVLAVKKKLRVLESERLVEHPPKVPQKILNFLETVTEASSAEMVKQCNITRHQLRHGLLKLLKDQQIEKLKTGLYRVMDRNKNDK
jgi:predicted transcriptional regulator